ncbi:MAG: hypothetical protein H7X88_05625 [Gloeobacteraceae cyanobacterium ES-bin-316]|nr:hypothetical protein [Ferruginibacter sp.]
MNSKLITPFLICMCLPFLFFCKQKKPIEAQPGKTFIIATAALSPASIEGIALPAGFKRDLADSASFTYWLRKLRLKKDPTVYLYDGSPKANQQAQYAVIDLSVGNKNLQQCADAVMRMRAEYLFSIKQFEAIRFIDNEGFSYNFQQPYTHENLLRYLQKVFGMCGTASLARQMKKINTEAMRAGDVWVRGGFPGHEVMVVDMASNTKGEKIYLLAQSYMPAQDIHILKNPQNSHDDPWYYVSKENLLETPEYIFKSTELKTW